MVFHYADCDNNYGHVNLDGQTTRALCILKGDIPDAVFRKQILYKNPVRFSVRAKYYSPWFPSHAIWYNRKYNKMADTYYYHLEWEDAKQAKYEAGKKALAAMKKEIGQMDDSDPIVFQKFMKMTKLENAVNHIAAEFGDWAYLGIDDDDEEEDDYDEDDGEYDEDDDEEDDDYFSEGEEYISDEDEDDEDKEEEDKEEEDKEEEEEEYAEDASDTIEKVAKTTLRSKLSRAFARGKKMVKGIFKRN